MAPRPGLRELARLLVPLWGLFLLSQFYRSTTAVIGPELSREIGLSAEGLGLLSGTFFVAMAVMQIPVGVLLDRYGPRRVIGSLLGFVVAGSLAMSAGGTLVQLMAAQAVIAIGCSAIYMGALVTYARWFPPDRFAAVVALSMAVGGVGNVLSSTPLAAAAVWLGWRGAFVLMATVTAVFWGLALAFVRDAPPGHPYHRRRPDTLRRVLAGVGEVIRFPALGGLVAMALVGYATLITVRGLWAGPYLADVFGLPAIPRGNVLLAMSIAMILGSVCYGPLDRVFDTRRGLVLGGGGLLVLLLTVLAAIPHPPLFLAVGLLVLIGAVGPFTSVLLTHAKGLFPERLVGRAVTVVNCANFTGVAAIQVATGLIAGGGGEGPVPAESYRWIFAFLAAALGLALLVYRRTPDVRPSLERARGGDGDSGEGGAGPGAPDLRASARRPRRDAGRGRRRPGRARRR